MFVKLFALFLVLGVCVAIPVEDSKHPVAVPQHKGEPVHSPGYSVPTLLPLTSVEPHEKDNSDLKTDASIWRTYWHRSYPVYYYRYPTYRYTYWY